MSNNELFLKEHVYGYRYDPVLKRYFKKDGEPYKKQVPRPKAPLSSSTGKQKSEILVKSGDRTSLVSPSGITQALHYQEMGLTKNTNFTRELIKMKIRGFKQVYNQKVSIRHEITSCDYIASHQNYFIGGWSVDIEDEFQGVLVKGEYMNFEELGNEINRDTYFSDENCFLSRMEPRCKISDMCIGDFDSDNLFVAVALSGSGIRPGRPTASVVCFRVPQTMETHTSRLIFRTAYQYSVESCAFGNTKKIVAVGLEKSAQIYSLDFSHLIPVALPGRPFSMHFSNDDNLLYCGLHNGMLLGIDFRVSTRAAIPLRLKLIRGIVNVKVLKNQTNIIASAFDHMLLNADLRSKKVVFQYPSHVNHYKRLLPLSYDETLDVLCSPGQDNITRLWSLSEGKLLSSIHAPLGDVPQNLHRSWFHSTPRGPLLHMWQGDTAYLYET